MNETDFDEIGVIAGLAKSTSEDQNMYKQIIQTIQESYRQPSQVLLNDGSSRKEPIRILQDKLEGTNKATLEDSKLAQLPHLAFEIRILDAGLRYTLLSVVLVQQIVAKYPSCR